MILANYSRGRRNQLLRLSAQWLRHFHEVCGIERKPAEASVMVERLQVAINEMTDQQRGMMLSDKSTARAIALLGERARSMDALSVDWSLFHRDFTPSNLIVSHNGTIVRGIDFGKASENAPVSFDLASFVVRTSCIGTGVMFSGTRVNDPRVSELIETVLKEYDAHFSELDRDWIMWCVLYWSVRRIVGYYTAGEVAGSWNIPRRMGSYLKERKNRRLVQVIYELV